MVVVGPTVTASALAELRPQAVLNVASGRIRPAEEGGRPSDAGSGGLWIFSSGTTGTPTPHLLALAGADPWRRLGHRAP